MKATLTCIVLLLSSICISQETYKRTLKLMGTRFDIIVVAQDEATGNRYIDIAIDEITRIEKLISSWDAASQTSAINAQAGIAAIQVDPELFNLIQRSLGISKLTDGAFDVSYASMDRIWKFDGSMKEMPSEEAIHASVTNVGFENIILDKTTHNVFLKNKNMKIGFGAIGKGYAADMAKALLIKEGATAGIINASGDMNTWGRQPNGDVWKVAITNPMDKTKNFGLLPINEGAVVTSGNYEKYVSFEGKRYTHIIDPRTGYPASGILSVTVFAPKAELADALATSLFVMGIDTGLNRINQLPDIECIIIDDSGNVHTSKNIKIDTL
ncbi:FAD:protein FMN transferase [Dokdonia sp.]|uniref:FAD:protein FMN transferase n=1 Tax=Dokdonia sp. TaxID=2024995 RepID=UPI003264DBA6